VSRDLVFAALVLTICGSLAWLPGLLPTTVAGRASGVARERSTWRRLWAPLVPAVLALGVLVGWRLQEPRITDELLRPTALALGVPLAVIWGRALVRALRALRVSTDGAAAAAVGLLRPRIVLDPAFGAELDAAAREAVLAHEHAHARHRDPLRLWVAQIATDLQWPFRSPSARFDAWVEALEIARDDEARHSGARGEDLASGLLHAARRAHGAGVRGAGAMATLTSSEILLAARVNRLLLPLHSEPVATSRARLWLVALAFAVAAATWLGWRHGDLVLRALPFVAS
jgi:hypothetical protein